MHVCVCVKERRGDGDGDCINTTEGEVHVYCTQCVRKLKSYIPILESR